MAKYNKQNYRPRSCAPAPHRLARIDGAGRDRGRAAVTEVGRPAGNEATTEGPASFSALSKESKTKIHSGESSAQLMTINQQAGDPRRDDK